MEGDQLSDLRKSVFVENKSFLPLYPSINEKNSNFSGSRAKKDFSPLEWRQFFDEKLTIKITQKPDNVFTVYSKSSDLQGVKPIIFLLHGGGYSGLTWACFAVKKSNQVTEMIDCQVLALDSRGHGDSVTDDDYDLSVDTQAHDVEDIIHELKLKSSIFLMGHRLVSLLNFLNRSLQPLFYSMGGAIAVHVASRNKIDSLIGLAVIDVVEGSAMDALNSMQSFLRARPTSFLSIDKAIEWW
uniref:protein phosphatase methylesterase-1 n=1 Tax=Romanomermis culicivorax TaxID=13658 RepID=A0A915JTR2_ROMCU